MSSNIFQVHGQSEGSAQLSVSARGFSIAVDQPESLGGSNRAPNPLEYLLAGLAGCVNVVAHRVAEELNIKIFDLCIDVAGDMNSDKFLGKFTLDRAGFQTIQVRINALTDASDDNLRKWLNIIETRSPVRDVLGKGTPIALSLKRKVKEEFCV